MVISKKLWNATIPGFLIFLLLFVYGGNVGTVTVAEEQIDETGIVGEITEEVVVEQTVRMKVNNFSGFSVKLGTYMRTNYGNIIIGLKRENGKVVYSNTIKADSVQDNQFVTVKFPPIKYSAGNRYRLFIESNGLTGSAVTAYINDQDSYPDSQLMINGTSQSGDLVFRLMYNKTLYERVIAAFS